MKKIDYNQSITNEHIDLDLYKRKFEFVDEYMQKKDIRMLKKILSDYTTFCYLMFRLNNKPLKLYPYQDLILNDSYRWKYFEASNQIGKSISLDVKGGRNLVKDHGHGHNEAIVSISLGLASMQMRRVKGFLNTSNYTNWKEEKGETDNMSVISYDVQDDKGKVKYTNYFICAPCTEGLLSYDLHELNLDEFEFWKDVDLQHFYNQIAEPRTYHTNGNITIFTNPNGQDNYGADLVKMRLPDGSKKFHTYNFNYLDCPGHTEEMLEIAKVGKTRAQIESTLLAIRTISDRNFFTPQEIESSLWKESSTLPMVGKQPYFFLDVGAKHDQSVLVGGYVVMEERKDGYRPLSHIYVPIIHVYPVGYPISRVVGSESSKNDGWHYEKSVKEYLKEWSVGGVQPIFGVDVTGNSGISPLFQACGINPFDVVFSGPAKSGMFQRFKYYMEKGLIHRKRCKEWEYQASHLEVKRSVRGYLTIHHERESDLDDTMDATAGLIYMADNPDNVPVSMTIIDINKPIEQKELKIGDKTEDGRIVMNDIRNRVGARQWR